MAEKTVCSTNIGLQAGGVDEEISPSDVGVNCIDVPYEMVSRKCDGSCEQTAKNAVCLSEYAPIPAKKTCYNSVVAASKEDVALEADDSGKMFAPFEEVYMPELPSQTVIKVENTETRLRSRRKQPCNVKKGVCEICTQKSGRKGLHVCRHVNIHFKWVTFTCNICSSTFRDENSFINHGKQHNGDKPFYCQFCNTWFCDLADLNSHADEFQHRALIHCSICGKRSARKFLVKFEIKERKYFTVGVRCKKVVKNSSEYFCEQCHPRNTYDCEICGRIFRKVHRLTVHFNISHHSGGPFKCNECFASYTTRCMLERHLDMHPGKQKPWVCHLCGFRFVEEPHYVDHLRNHKALKPFSCDNCGKNFCYEVELKSHLDEHEAHALDCLSESLTHRCSSVDEEISTLSTESYDSVNGMSTLAAHNLETSNDSSNDCVQIANILDKSIGIEKFEESETVLARNRNDCTFPEYNKSFSLDDVKQEVLSDDEACVTIQERGSADETVGSCIFENRNTVVDVEKQKTLQQANEKNLCSVSVKKEVILNEESVDETVVKNGVKEEASSEFCPLDFVSTELTLCKNETLITDNIFFPDMSGEIVTDIECTSSKEPCLTSEVMLKTEWDETVPTEELNIPVDIKEEISYSPSVNSYLKKEVNCSTCHDDCELNEDGMSAVPEQQSGIVVDSELPFYQENQHVSAFPVSSRSDVKLETDQRFLSDNPLHTKKRRCCCICHTFVESPLSLLQHYQTVHHFQPRYLCKVCMEPFDSMVDLCKHKLKAHKVNMRCPLCERRYLKTPVFEAHCKKHYGNVPYFCTTCQTWFRDLDELQHHRTSAFPNRQLYHCTHCGKKNTWKFEIERKNKERFYICEECGKFRSNRLVTCEKCGQLSRCASIMQNHYISEHTGRHRCKHCDMVFDSACVKKGHIESMCGTLKMFTCTACGRWFRCQNELEQHNNVHNILAQNYK